MKQNGLHTNSISFGTTNSATPEINVLEIEQLTPEGILSSPLVSTRPKKTIGQS